ncbi:hypothetical protein Tco_0918326, partial [Tanacetum coccineum]
QQVATTTAAAVATTAGSSSTTTAAAVATSVTHHRSSSSHHRSSSSHRRHSSSHRRHSSSHHSRMACVAPRSHGGDAGGSPPRRPTRPVPAQCQSSNRVSWDRGKCVLKGRAFRLNNPTDL